jgi:hypothetical protein
MFEHNKQVPCIPCFIITDAAGLKKYGLGMVRGNAQPPPPISRRLSDRGRYHRRARREIDTLRLIWKPPLQR